MEEYKYTIGNKVYFQKPLVIGQVSQLLNLLKDVKIPSEINVLTLITLLGDKLSKAIAIILIEPDKPLKSKNVDELVTEIEFELSPEMAIKIVEDFFDCNPISSLLEKMGNTVNKIAQKMKIEETG